MKFAKLKTGIVILILFMIYSEGDAAYAKEEESNHLISLTEKEMKSSIEEEYVFDEEYWENCAFDVIPKTLQEEQSFWRQKGNVYSEYSDESGCYYYEIIHGEEKVRIRFIKDVEGEVRIPNEIAGYPVTEIGLPRESFLIESGYFDGDLVYDSVFLPSTCEKVTSLILPKALEYIGYQAFSYCRNMESVQLPNSLKQMETCFEYCESLEELVLPEEIRDVALYYVPLENITVSGDRIRSMHLADMNIKELVIHGNVESLSLRRMPELERVVLTGCSQFTVRDTIIDCGQLEELILPYSISEFRFSEEFAAPIRITIPNPDCDYWIFPNPLSKDFSNVTLVIPVNSRMEEIPDAYGITKEVLSPNNEDGTEEFCYIVEKGDTLWGLSRRYRCTVEELVRVNEIANPELIYIGQELWVPVME